MPTYNYKCDVCGGATEEVRHIDDRWRPSICAKCGGWYLRDEETELRQHGQKAGSPVWISEAMGCQPHEIEEFKKLYPGSEYDGEGRLIMRSLAERNKRLKERGLVDRG